MSKPIPLPQPKTKPFFVVPALATEMGQALARICWTLLFGSYLIFNQKNYALTEEYEAAWWLTGGHFVFATLVLISTCRTRTKSAGRRLATLAVDQVLLASLLYYSGAIAAPFVLVPLFFTFGSGLRYGRAYSAFSSMLSASLIFFVLSTSSYWAQDSALRIGLAFGFVYLPLYVFGLTESLSTYMRTDPLTKLKNRIGFDELVKSVCDVAYTAKSESAVIFIDLDGFKQVNDAHGHDVGDSALKHVGFWLNYELSPYGVPARFGGDEFAVVIKRMHNRKQVEEALDRFLLHTASVGKLFDSSLGASIGVYYIAQASTVTPRFVYKAADQLMYKAKKSGKNQFITSTGRTFSDEGHLVVEADTVSPHSIA